MNASGQSRLILFSALFLSLSIGINVSGQGVDPLDSFLGKFAAAATSHDSGATMDCMYPKYRRRQHNRFLKGNTEQFLDEFFSGTIDGMEDFYNGKFMEITRVEILSVKPEGGNFVVTVRTTFGNIPAIHSLLLHSWKKGNNKRFGFEGASG